MEGGIKRPMTPPEYRRYKKEMMPWAGAGLIGMAYGARKMARSRNRCSFLKGAAITGMCLTWTATIGLNIFIAKLDSEGAT